MSRNDNPRVIKRDGHHARNETNRPAMHGTKSEQVLMSGLGALIKSSPAAGSDYRVKVTGEKPGGQRP